MIVNRMFTFGVLALISTDLLRQVTSPAPVMWKLISDIVILTLWGVVLMAHLANRRRGAER